MGWGTYTGVLQEMNEHEIVIQTTRDDGSSYPKEYREDQSWSWPRSAEVRSNAEKLNLTPGDLVCVDVEFNSYTVMEVRNFHTPRSLHERLLRVEKHLGLVDDS